MELPRARSVTIAIAGALLLSGCAGYRIGNGTLYAPDIRTVYVPMFESESFRRNLGEWLTEAVVKEIELKTPYKVVSTRAADSILSGRILGETKRVIVRDPYDEPRQFETNFQVEVTWVDRQGQLLRESTAIPLPPAVAEIGQAAASVPEVGQSVATAQQQAIARLAEQIVALMETPW